MPTPQSITDLSITAASNSPQGSENVGPTANTYIQAAFAFIAQLASGAGFTLKQAFNANAQKFTNVGTGTVSSTSADLLNASQVIGLAQKIGEVRMWHGTVANIAKVWGSGWQLADGSNGTADLRDRFILAAGTGKTNDTGGNSAMTLKIENLPSHTHTLTDTGHSHGVDDPGHTHSSGRVDSSRFPVSGGDGYDGVGTPYSGASSSAKTGISVRAAATGISIKETGGGIAFDNRPAYYVLAFVEYTGVGV